MEISIINGLRNNQRNLYFESPGILQINNLFLHILKSIDLNMIKHLTEYFNFYSCHSVSKNNFLFTLFFMQKK